MGWNGARWEATTSIEIMLFHTLQALEAATKAIERNAEATQELVEVTKALHRERAAAVRQEADELEPDDTSRRSNVKMFHLHERLKALDMPPRTNGIASDETPGS